MHAQEPGVYAEGYVSVAQLRDDVLRDEFSAGRRKKLWERVQRKVEGNANVRPMVRAGRTGDVGRMWEWVGAVGMLESPAGAERSAGRGRSSLGGVVGDDRSIEPGRESNVGEVRKWEDGGARPYY